MTSMSIAHLSLNFFLDTIMGALILTQLMSVAQCQANNVCEYVLEAENGMTNGCLLYTSDAADE